MLSLPFSRYRLQLNLIFIFFYSVKILCVISNKTTLHLKLMTGYDLFYDLITSTISIISYQIPHAIKMTTFAFIFKASFIRPRYFVHVGLYNTFAHCARRIRDHPRFRDGDENDRICPRSWSANCRYFP
jgi:hypothetical protein